MFIYQLSRNYFTLHQDFLTTIPSQNSLMTVDHMEEGPKVQTSATITDSVTERKNSESGTEAAMDHNEDTSSIGGEVDERKIKGGKVG